MNAASPYVTETRRARESVYRSRLRRAVASSLVLHVALFVVLAPVRHKIPLVRHVGYEGAVQILPEISVRRPPGERESERETAYGRGTDPMLRVVNARIVNGAHSINESNRAEPGDLEDDDLGEDILRYLEEALPQPTSRDVVITKLVKPAYPPVSIEAGVEGVVVFRVHVTKRGRVARVWLVESQVDRACEEAARRALLQWRFRPHVTAGVPTDFLVDQRIRFRLRDASSIAPPLRG